MKRMLLSIILAACTLGFVSSCDCPKNPSASVPVLKKEQFYKDGKFDAEAAKQAYFDMMERFGMPISKNMRENMWATDFGLGDFPAVGMGGIFWAQDDVHGVFGHEILLLPNQMLVEHYHIAADKNPAKNECWQAKYGTTYCFGEAGEDASKFPNVKLPESQKKFVTVDKVAVSDAKEGNVVWLNRLTARHYQIAGAEGAIVTEYGVFHSGKGVQFTNPGIKF